MRAAEPGHSVEPDFAFTAYSGEMDIMKDLARFALVFAVLVGFSGCNGKDKKTEGEEKTKTEGGEKTKTGKGKGKKRGGSVTIDQSSPQKVTESFQKALKAKDWNGTFACLTESSQDTLAIGALMTAGFSTFGNEQRKTSLDKVLKGHGLDVEGKKKPGAHPLEGVASKPAFFGDLMEWLDNNPLPNKSGKSAGSFVDQLANAEITNFKIDGDTATADISMGGKKKSQPAEFKKIDGKWYISMEQRGGRVKRTAPPPFPKKDAGKKDGKVKKDATKKDDSKKDDSKKDDSKKDDSKKDDSKKDDSKKDDSRE